jgi:hypothetical protein
MERGESGHRLVGIGDDQFALAGEVAHQLSQVLLRFCQGDRLHGKSISQIRVEANTRIGRSVTGDANERCLPSILQGACEQTLCNHATGVTT